MKRNLLNPLKSIHQKPTAIIIIGEKPLEASPSTSGTSQGCLLFLFLVSVILEVLAKAESKGKWIKGIELERNNVRVQGWYACLDRTPSNPQIMKINQKNDKINKIQRVSMEFTRRLIQKGGHRKLPRNWWWCISCVGGWVRNWFCFIICFIIFIYIHIYSYICIYILLSHLIHNST